MRKTCTSCQIETANAFGRGATEAVCLVCRRGRWPSCHPLRLCGGCGERRERSLFPFPAIARCWGCVLGQADRHSTEIAFVSRPALPAPLRAMTPAELAERDGGREPPWLESMG